MRSFILLLLISSYAVAQKTPLIEPPFWWTGMKATELHLLVHAEGIAYTAPRLIYPGVQLINVEKTENPDYLFLELSISEKTMPGTFSIEFDRDENMRYTYEYELKAREDGSAERKGFSPADVIYLIMPDRFANGDADNDDMPGMLEKADRRNPDGRHGGDLKGIAGHLNYIQDMGFTAVWLNPLLENNNPKYSYHGYAITDFYHLDPRIGSNEEYVQFVDDCHKHDVKVIMDMVFNHCGEGHWWVKNMPSEDWVHQWPEFTRSNFRAPVNSDPYASDYDKRKMQHGWFDTNMPDLNQQNKFLASYLIQNSIWWVEYAGLDGIRMDTYPYSDQDFMKKWMKRIRFEYPDFYIVGETWLQKEAITAYYAESETERFGYNSLVPSVTDFPLYYAIEKAFHEEESWTEGMARLYYVLAQDFLYDDAYSNVIFVDNHDLSRFFSVMERDVNKYKMGLAFLLTTRGIPLVYYGTEILMEGEEPMGHGYIREDFPGGWQGDETDVSMELGLSAEQREAKDFLRSLLNWRMHNTAIHKGELAHFIPEAGVYIYFRIHDEEAVMIVLNNNNSQISMPGLNRFDECLEGRRKAREVISELNIEDLQEYVLPPKSASILEISDH
ncbi:MAG: glycoside hydrolase family 13 protein [Bacteroidota bacterium]